MARLATAVIILVLLLPAATPTFADETEGAQSSDRSAVALPPQCAADSAALETFLDGLLATQMSEQHIAGAAVSVVSDGQVLLAKGYGYADLEKGIPVDPERTLFRIASITKLFTWTAVMQLVEEGKLDLDADINTYLDFPVPDTYPQPITLKNLLTHTDGFEERLLEVLVLTAEDMAPPRDWLISHMPARVRPPGDVAAYSNYGTSLAGYIVARVSGKPYGEYVQERILDPLGMTHSTVQPVASSDVRANQTVGYTYVDGAFKEFPDYLGQPGMAPAGGMLASATDISHFMIAHLEGGRYSDADAPETRILGESTTQRMHGQLFTHHPRLLGTAHGFFEFTENGQRTIGHSGEADPISSLLLLVPEQKLGVFVVYNSSGGSDLTNQHLGFQRAFFDHCFPAPALDPIMPPAGFEERAGRFAGTYKMTRGSYTTQEKVTVLMGSAVAVSDPGDGTLILATPWGEWQFIEVEPLYFRQVDAPFGIAFREDDQGRVTHMFTDYTPMMAFEKLSWYEEPGFNTVLLVTCVVAFLSVIPMVSIRAIRNRRRTGEHHRQPGGARAALWTLVGISVLNLLFVVGTWQWGDPRPMFGVSLMFKIVLGLGVVSAALTIGATGFTAIAWKNRYWGIAARAYYTVVTLAAIAFVWFLHSWNLLGWRF
ncbi:serine hydrolase domain-containing protein [Agromyces humatus]|uniref:serine hydrolase domain-containing protein n=1 Tax=Agromyces humatus TaxID=279573 RepID=UPI001E59A9C2|nr:serine hydrolase domain-containing protein [Agromyces humatus]